MKKVLILSYFFPPCNLTGANRPMGWFKYLHEFGYYPVVVTRNWSTPIATETDICLAAGAHLEVEKTAGGEIHRIPFKPKLRDRLVTQKNKSLPWLLLQKLLTLVELIFGRWIPKMNPSYALGKYAETLSKQDPEVRCLIISANPYPQFYFGRQVHKKTKIPWIADYRDDWTTNELVDRSGFIGKLLHQLDRKSERLWVKSAAYISSVSPYYTRKISEFTGRPGISMLNGYNREIRKKDPEPNPCFHLLYSGSLYKAQPIESMVHTLAKVLEALDIPWKISFQGILYHQDQAQRVLHCLPETWKHKVVLSERSSAEIAFEEMCQADVLLLPSYQSLKGVPSSKLFEYIAARRTMLIFPGDQDIIDSIAARLTGALVCPNESELTQQTQKLASDWKNGKKLPVPSQEEAQAFSRKRQTETLARLLDQMQADKA